jgi:hypothetical protein
MRASLRWKHLCRTREPVADEGEPVGMRTSQIQKRLQTLSGKICPNAKRGYTLEELCRVYWRQDKRGFVAFMQREFTGLRVFAEMFQHEDERAARARRSGR